jgi:hypothetical protein
LVGFDFHAPLSDDVMVDVEGLVRFIIHAHTPQDEYIQARLEIAVVKPLPNNSSPSTKLADIAKVKFSFA